MENAPEQNEHAPAPSPPSLSSSPPLPVRPLSYTSETSGASGGVAIVRTIGVMAVVLAPLQVVLLALSWWLAVDRWREYGPLWQVSFALMIPAELILSLLLLLGGIGCLRSRPRGRRVLIVCSWGSLAVTAYGVAVGLIVSIQLMPNAGRPSVATALYIAGHYIDQGIGGVAFPVMALVFLTRPPVAALFDGAR